MGLEKYCIYIRKSRKDMEAEERGEGDTLARHEAALMDLAHKMGLHITAIYKGNSVGRDHCGAPGYAAAFKRD